MKKDGAMEVVMSQQLEELQEKIEYHFTDEKLLRNALTHSSYANEKHWPYEKNNERLEFLGDAVLEVFSSDHIFRENSKMVEGKMTKLRASLVCEMRDWIRTVSLPWKRRKDDRRSKKRFYFIGCL